VAGVSFAIPYASGVKLEGGVLTFVLNENAQGVKVIAGAISKDLGALNKGTIVTNLGISGPFRIEVSNSTAGGWVQTSTDTNILVRFNSPRGVAVNNNPASPYFGRVYVANSAAGNTTGVVRAVGDGIYVLNADQTDALGQGNTALNGGANFTAGGTSSPYRVTVGEDGNLYICDWSDAAGNLTVVDPNISAGSAKFVLKPLAATAAPGNASIPVGLNNTHGSIAAAVVTGSLAAGNLAVYVVDEDLQTDREATGFTEMNSIWRFDVGSGPLPSQVEATERVSGTVIGFVSQTMDLTRGPNGYLYVSCRRSNGTEAGVQVIDPAEPDPALRLKFSSLTASTDLGEVKDLMFAAGGVTVSRDGKWIAVYRYDNNEVLVAPLVDGIPQLANRVVFPAFGTTAAGRGIAFDAAGNLHVVSSGFGMYRVYSPGGTTVASTTSDGTFAVVTPLSTITAIAAVTDTAEGGTPVEFTVSRSGSTTAALTVNVALTGTAANGSDYNTIASTVTFPAGQSTVSIPVTAIDDSVSEAPETVTLTIQGSPNYTAGNPGVATVTIADNDAPLLSLAASYPTAYERVVDDYIRFEVTRLGDLASEVTANVSISGPGASGVTAPPTVTVPAGAAKGTFDVHPVDNAVLDGNRDVVATLTAGAGYSIGTASATGTIIDDEIAPETGKILFSDNFNTDSSANWKTLFGAGNDIDDQLVAFAYDYVANDGIPAAPSGSTVGLKMTVNKFEGTALGGAGVNVYPKGKTFSGDFAVRFNMFLLLNDGAGTTEHALVGINASGSKTNWARQTAASAPNLALDQDGLWAAIVADGSVVNALGHVLYTGNGPTQPAKPLVNVDPADLAGVFKAPPYQGTGLTALAGSPANTSDSATKTWVDVEMRQVGSVVTLLINKSVVLNYTNTTAYTSGNILLGYNDQFDSVGNAGAVYIDDLRVVDLTTAAPVQPTVSSIAINGGNVVIDFTGGASDEAAVFQLQGKAAIEGSFAAETATITKVAAGQFRATLPVNGNVRFYRIRR
jgi:hypothetical protein